MSPLEFLSESADLNESGIRAWMPAGGVAQQRWHQSNYDDDDDVEDDYENDNDGNDDGDDDDDDEAETEGLLNVIVSWIIFAGWKHQSITSNGRKY